MSAGNIANGVLLVTKEMTDAELAAQNNVMQVNWDPRNVQGYEKIQHLYTLEQDGVPVAHEEVKKAFASIVLDRLGS